MMLLILNILISTGFSFNKTTCDAEIERYGNAQGHDKISTECLNLYRNLAPTNCQKYSALGEMKAIAADGIFILEDNPTMSVRYSAGSEAQVGSCTSLAIDPIFVEVAILDASRGEIAIYNAQIMGNVAPRRIIKSEYLIDATDLEYQNDKILVLNKQQQTLFSFSRLANSTLPEAKRQDRLTLISTDVPPNASKITFDNTGKPTFEVQPGEGHEN
ncbi:MAG: hypothetical protein JNM93_06290 [Bacteriovoracaceae bacterium]|nr:hypothetical protein [Bacteriovoracaceae bacterium]